LIARTAASVDDLVLESSLILYQSRNDWRAIGVAEVLEVRVAENQDMSQFMNGRGDQHVDVVCNQLQWTKIDGSKDRSIALINSTGYSKCQESIRVLAFDRILDGDENVEIFILCTLTF